MPRVVYTAFNGEEVTIDGILGESVMRTAVTNGVPGIVGECGGVLSCATCHVFLNPEDQSRIPPMNELEDEMLDGTAVDRRECSRLSCQIRLTEELDVLHVSTPEFQE